VVGASVKNFQRGMLGRVSQARGVPRTDGGVAPPMLVVASRMSTKERRKSSDNISDFWRKWSRVGNGLPQGSYISDWARKSLNMKTTATGVGKATSESLRSTTSPTQPSTPSKCLSTALNVSGVPRHSRRPCQTPFPARITCACTCTPGRWSSC